MIQEIELRSLSKIIMGQSPDGETYNKSGVGKPLLNGPTEFGTHHPTPVLFTTDSKRECKKGDLIFCVRGSTTGRMNWADQSYSLGRGVCSISGKVDFDTVYIKYCLELFLPSLLNLAGGSTFPNLNKDDIGKFKIPYSADASKIGEILSAYDELIELNNQRIKLLEETAHQLYKEWFVRMRFPGYSKTRFTKGIPADWEVKKLNDLVDTQYGYTASASVENIGPKFLRITDVANSKIDWDSVPHCSMPGKDLKKYLVSAGDILIARTGATVGFAKRINKLHPPSVFASYLVRVKAKNPILNSYLGIIIESENYKEYIQAVATGAAQPQANAVLMTGFYLLKPTNQLLERFNLIIEPIFDQQEILQQQNTHLSQIRDRLLPRMVSGKLQVKAVKP